MSEERSFAVSAKLAVMMFLQFVIWGAWYVTAPNYLSTIGFTADDFSWTYAVGPFAGMISPFFVGMIADRFFPAQRVLGVLHLIGGGIMIYATMVMKGGDPSAATINWMFFGHMLCFYPTLALSNSLAMRHMTNPEKQFPVIRVFGTLGWIFAGIFLTFMSWDTSIDMFYVSGFAAIALGIFSLFLPHTPPVGGQGKVTVRDILGLDAFVLLKDRSYLIFILASMLICIPLAFYYQIASRVVETASLPIGLTMSTGQMSEVFFMLLMPFFFAKLGVKKMLAIGMAAWVLRYVLFAYGTPNQVGAMIIFGILLHGICYDFFFVTGQIYTDQIAPKAIRSQAQGMLVFFTLGLGMFIGAKVAGVIETGHTPQASLDLKAQVVEVNAQIEAAGEGADTTALTEQATDLRLQELRAVEWKPLWLKPAGFAGGVLIIFLLLFREPARPLEEPVS